ncbi:MAG: DUF4199 domain-containing protein [Jejuia sp.]
METNQQTPGKFSVNYGLILGIIMIVISVVMYATGMMLEGKQWPMFIYYIIFPVFVIYTINKYKKHNANTLKLGEALKVGVSVAVVSAVVYGLYNILFNYLIDPEFIDKMMDVTREKLYENEKMTEEMIDKSMEMARKFSHPLIGSAMWIGLSALFGLIYSLIGGLVMKNE